MPNYFIMRRSSQDYIRLNKKITYLPIILGLTKISKDWGMTSTECCYKIITEFVMDYNKKKEQPVPHFELPKK